MSEVSSTPVGAESDTSLAPLVDVDALRCEVRRREESIGITKTLFQLVAKENDVHGDKEADYRILCAFKTLYSDFIVRELSPLYKNGEPLTLELSNSATPMGKKRSREDEEKGTASASISTSSSAGTTGTVESDAISEASPLGNLSTSEDELYVELFSALKNLLRSEDLETLKKGLETKSEKIILEYVEKKEDRTKVHQCVRQFLNHAYLSSTENQKLIIAKATAAGRRLQQQRSTPLRQRGFLHFTVYKENIDSAHAFRLMAKYLHLSTRQIEFCGTKDKRAVTLQRVAIRDIDAARISHLNRCSFGSYQCVKVGGFQSQESGLRLGDANGNHFTVVLRLYPQALSTFSASTLAEVEETLRTRGVMNYFGPQRFGTTDTLTSEVGIAILQGRIKEAVLAMLHSKATFVPDMRPVIAYLESKEEDFASAYERTPHFCLQERDLLRHLLHHPRDYQGALLTLPRTVAMLYCHAVQSLIWNKMASNRLQDPSRVKVEVGDIVLERVYQLRCQEEEASRHASPVINYVSELGVDQGLEEEGAGGSASDETSPTTGTSTSSSSVGALPRVRCLRTEDPLEKFSLLDVLLPVPGPDPALVFPESRGCSKQDVRKMLEERGIADMLLLPEPQAVPPQQDRGDLQQPQDGTPDACTEEAVKSKTNEHQRRDQLLKILHFHGTYRPLLVRPQRVSLRTTEVRQWGSPVLLTDWEKLQRSDATPVPETTSASLHASAVKNDVPSPSSPSFLSEEDSTTDGKKIKEEAHPPGGALLTSAGSSTSVTVTTSSPLIPVVIADFSLPSGSYATSVLREFAMFALHTHPSSTHGKEGKKSTA